MTQEKINIAELLKDCPKGMELYSPLCGDCKLYDVNEYNIRIETPNKATLISLYHDGKYCSGGEIMLFPKGKTTWEGFHRPFKDGDIVATQNGIWIGIYKRVVGNAHEVYLAIYHDCLIYNDNIFCFERLATEDEKQKLFNAIKDNGYEWNYETKTLEKLPKFKVGDRIILKDNPHNIPSIKIKAVTKSQYILESGGFFYIDSADEKYVLENKFDITTLKPFDRVLVRLTNNCVWMPKFFSRYDSEMKCYSFIITDNVGYPQCIPYEGNKHLAGKTDDCDEYYKSWK